MADGDLRGRASSGLVTWSRALVAGLGWLLLDRPAAGDAATVHRLLLEANVRLEAAVKLRAADTAAAAEAFGTARPLAIELDRDHALPLTRMRLERAEGWDAARATTAVAMWRRLANAEVDPVRAAPEELTRLVEACRALEDPWCEARALVARAESQAQSSLPVAVREDASAAEAILRQAGPCSALARALVLLRGHGGGDRVAQKARERYDEAVAQARAIGDPVVEGRALCETVRIDLGAGERDAARARLDRIAEIARRADAPRVAGCGAYFEGLSLFLRGDRSGARATWDAFASSAPADRAPRELLWILVGSTAASIRLYDGTGALERARRAVDLSAGLAGDDDRLRAYCNLASAWSMTGRPREGAPAAATCLELSRKLGFRQGEVIALWRLADGERDPERALALLDEALSLGRVIQDHHDVVFILLESASTLRDLGRLVEARRRLEEALELARTLRDETLEANAEARLALLLAELGEADAAEALARKATERLGESGPESLRAPAARALGLALARKNDFAGALTELERAFELFARSGSTILQAHVANDLGNAHFVLYRLDRAGEYYEQALALARRHGAPDLESTATANLALLRARFGLDAGDRPYILDAAARARRGPLSPGNVAALSNLAGELYRLGEHDAAEATGRVAVARASRLGAPALAADAGAQLVAILAGRGGHNEALDLCTRLDSEWARLDDRARLSLDWTCGAVLRAAGRPAAAAERLRKAVEQAARIRYRVRTVELRASFLGDRTVLYGDLVGAVLEAAGPEPEASIVAEVLRISEESRAELLLEALAGRAEIGAGEAEDRGEGDGGRRDFLARMAELHLAAARAPADEQERRLAELRSLEDRLAARGPRTAIGAAIATLDEIRRALPDGRTAALEYLLGEEESFLFAITREGARVVRLPIGRARLHERVLLFRSLLERRESGATGEEEMIERLGRKLYRDLVEPVEPLVRSGMIERLVIAPDGALHYLPFEALVTADTPAGEVASYLVEQVEIARVPSLSVYRELRRSERRVEPGRALVALADARSLSFSFEAGPSADTGFFPAKLPALPYAAEEIRGAARHLRGERLLWIGSDATEARATQALEAGYAIVHFAVHGFLDGGSIGRSGLLLTPTPEQGEDGLLQAREVVDLDVNAGLVVLSGCSTGSGRYVGREGVMGLTHALLQAGATDLVVSLWEVRDRGAALFMSRFYASLARGLPVGQALRRAKLDLLASGRPELRHPAVWAPFVAVGPVDRPVDARGARNLPAESRPALAVLLALTGLALWWISARASRLRP